MLPSELCQEIAGEENDDDEHDHVSHGGGQSDIAILEGFNVGKEHGEHRGRAGAPLGEYVHKPKRVEVPDEAERCDRDDDRSQCRKCDVYEATDCTGSVDFGRLNELVWYLLKASQQ